MEKIEFISSEANYSGRARGIWVLSGHLTVTPGCVEDGNSDVCHILFHKVY